MRIIGWAFIFFGIWVVIGLILRASYDALFAADPFFYISSILIVSSVVVLARDVKSGKPTAQLKKNHLLARQKENRETHTIAFPPEVLQLLAQYQEDKNNREGK